MINNDMNMMNNANTMNTENTNNMGNINLNQPFFFCENYHSHYDDDDCDFYFYNPVTREFTHDEWTTRFACGACPKYSSKEFVDAINAGLIDRRQFIDDLIAKYGLKINTWYSRGRIEPICRVHFNVPVDINIRGHKGKGYFLYRTEGFRSRYGRVESYVKHMVDENGNYFETTSNNWEIAPEAYDLLRQKLYETENINLVIAYILPWNEADYWKLFPLVNVNYADSAINYEAAKENARLEKKREYYQEKFNGAYEWSVKTFGSEKTNDEHIEMAKRLLSKYQGVTDVEFVNSLIANMNKSTNIA